MGVAAALREMVRVTRPGGVIAAAVWDYAEEIQMLRIFWDKAVARDPGIAGRDERNMPLGDGPDRAFTLQARARAVKGVAPTR
jgi:hypothetical protein